MTTQKQPALKKIFGIFICITAWLTLAFQFSITQITFLNYVSYFTTLCNSLIAICLTFSLLAPKSSIGIFFSSLSVQSAIALYIFIVSVVYNLVLRGLVPLSGWPYILDNMVHVVIPVLYIIYWIFFRPEGVLSWRDALYWIIFPAAYLVYSLVRGSVIAWYPYPFLNAIRFGYAKVFFNVAAMLLLFLAGGFALILITRRIKSKATSR